MAQEVQKLQSPHERETQLADDYLKSATLARQVAHQALEKTLEELNAGTLRDPAKAAVSAATAGGIMLDKRLILEGRPTQIVHTEDPKKAALALARRLGVTIESTAVDVEPLAIEPPESAAKPSQSNEHAPRTNELPLPVGSQRAKPRTRAKRRPAAQPAD